MAALHARSICHVPIQGLGFRAMMQLVLEGNADAVEFCPNSSRCNLLAAATYTLVEKTADAPEDRVGTVSLFEIQDGQDATGLKRLDHVETAGVFDIRWRPPKQGTEPLLAQAGSDGSLRIYSLQEGLSSLKEIATLNTNSAMCLFVEWDPFGTCSEHGMVVSHSNGSVSVANLGRGCLELEQNWEAHEFEVWTASYDAWNQGLIYSGADDSQFCGWDLRGSLDCPVFKDKKSHEMGVCCIQSNSQWENVLATGSYDENLRLWDLRMMHRPFLKHKLGLGGGVWKIKWHPFKRGLLLAACMHNGFAILDVDDGVKILEEYKEHKSLAYGADWSKNNCASNLQIATCSFYDKALHLWKPHLDLFQQT